ncbi:hypothetical protein TcCL_Unassigned04243 [Trypanosoma cruzi]|nr:hypothetical protein TcCL_Unassigned04243 [Trypanosoma cruzi]
MKQEEEGRGTADTARERADNMRKGQQAQPHSSHTTRRHPRNEGTQRQQPPTMQEEKTSTTISTQLISTANGKWPKPAATTQRTRSEHPPHQPHEANKPSSIHNAAPKFPAIPPSMGHGAKLSAVTRGAPHPQERRLVLRTPSLHSPHGHERRQQPPHATASMHYKRSIQIHCNVHLVVVWLCVPAETQSKKGKEKKATNVERRTKMYSGGAWRKQQEEGRSNS